MPRLLRTLVLSALWLGVWLLLTSKATWDELAVGAVCALIAGAAGEAAWGAYLTAFGADPRLLLQALRVPPLLVADTVRVFAVLLRHLFTRDKAGSILRTVRFDPGPPDDAHARARRALAIGLFTMTPNGIAIGIGVGPDGGQLLYHQLVAAPLPRLLRRLGGAP